MQQIMPVVCEHYMKDCFRIVIDKFYTSNNSGLSFSNRRKICFEQLVKNADTIYLIMINVH